MVENSQQDQETTYTNPADIISVETRHIVLKDHIFKGYAYDFKDDALVIGRADGEPMDVDAQELRKAMIETLTQYNTPDNYYIHHKTIVFDGPVRIHGDAQSLFAPAIVENDIDDMSDEYERYFDIYQYSDTVDTKITFGFDDSLTLVDTENVTNMDEMFRECSDVHNLNVSSFNTENVTSMRAMFAGSDVRQLDISNFNTENVTDMREMFSNCLDLSRIKMGDLSARSLETADKMFNNCRELEVVDSPSRELGKALAKLDRQPNHDCEFDSRHILYRLENVKLATKADTIMDVELTGKPVALRHVFYGTQSRYSVDASWKADGTKYDDGAMPLKVNKVNSLRTKAETIEKNRMAALHETIQQTQGSTKESQLTTGDLGE